MLLVPSKHESNFLFTYYYLQNTTDTKESLENELAKVTKDRDLSMKKKDELAGILSQAAQALRASLAVSYFFFSLWERKEGSPSFPFSDNGELMLLLSFSNFWLLSEVTLWTFCPLLFFGMHFAFKLVLREVIFMIIV